MKTLNQEYHEALKQMNAQKAEMNRAGETGELHLVRFEHGWSPNRYIEDTKKEGIVRVAKITPESQLSLHDNSVWFDIDELDDQLDDASILEYSNLSKVKLGQIRDKDLATTLVENRIDRNDAIYENQMANINAWLENETALAKAHVRASSNYTRFTNKTERINRDARIDAIYARIEHKRRALRDEKLLSGLKKSISGKNPIVSIED